MGVPDAHPSPKGWPELCVWNFFTNKTLLERAGLRTGAPSTGAFLSGVCVSGTPFRNFLHSDANDAGQHFQGRTGSTLRRWSLSTSARGTQTPTVRLVRTGTRSRRSHQHHGNAQFVRGGVWAFQTAISHRTGWLELCVWNFFTNKTLLERPGLRTGAPSMCAFLSGVWVSGTPEVWVSGTPSDRDIRAKVGTEPSIELPCGHRLTLTRTSRPDGL